MNITKEMIPLIEKAMGFKLYDWQKKYLMGEEHEVPNGRAVGRTTAYIIRLLLTNNKPIEIGDVGRYADRSDSHYKHWFKGEVKYIHDKLTDSGLITKVVTKTKPNQSLSIAIDADTNKLQVKLRAIAKHAEALADELDAIDHAWQCECGSSSYGDVYHDNLLVERVCDECKERYAYNVDDLPTRFEGSE